MEQPTPSSDKPTPDIPYASPATPVASSSLQAGPDIWITIIIGVVLMMMAWDFAEWAIVTVQGKPYDTRLEWSQGERAGQTVPYWEIVGYKALSESAVFLFGAALVVEALSMLMANKRPGATEKLLGVSLVITAAATVYNAYVMVVLFSVRQRPIISVLAVAFGGYMVLSLWKLIRSGARAKAPGE